MSELHLVSGVRGVFVRVNCCVNALPCPALHQLRDEPGVLVQVKAAEKISDTKLSITLTEGKYHQVSRQESLSK